MERNKMRKLALAAAIVAAIALPAFAQKGSLNVKSEVFKEVQERDATGVLQAKTVPAPKAAPGDSIVYVTTIKNIGTAPADNVVIDNPVPPQLVYQGSYGDAKEAIVSVDGKTYDVLSRLQTIAADGSAKPASSADVHYLRWTLNYSLKPGEVATVSYRALLK
jgi:uncharacterized repeat protein (TIGR01451 family)